MDDALYRIEEFTTMGWTLMGEDRNLTKEECNIKLQNYMSEGYNPNRLRVSREK
jgi:hypothetical protein|tara:strand:+ start:108 stop:269 length:162 start_codon:yes stop_codon:yes gene_type:complete